METHTHGRRYGSGTGLPMGFVGTKACGGTTAQARCSGEMVKLLYLNCASICHLISIYCSCEARTYYIASQSLANSSSSPSTSGNTTAGRISLSCTYPIILQTPRHRSARVDWTESRLRTWDRTRHPWLKVRSTSTEVAEKVISKYKKQKGRWCTGNGQIIKSHPVEAQVHMLMLILPDENVLNMLRIST